ncbi:MAG: fructose-bisphosphate aldolase class I [Pseudomonadales bacterium]|nr:fructose-bisphosphate aldolase class I [Pseudomonadales bacterium]
MTIISQELQQTIEAMAVRGKGILAADESSKTIAKRFADIGVDSTETSRCNYRSLLLSTPHLGDFISGVILFEETLGQHSSVDHMPIPQLAASQNIVPGIKVDKGLTELANCLGEQVTQGLDGLRERLVDYKKLGARFAKWRNVYHISSRTPSRRAIDINAEMLARYAALCQEQGIVPIVEPEVLINGTHSIEQCAEATEAAIQALFHALYRHGVVLEQVILKPNMVVPGNESGAVVTPEQVAEQTLRVLRRTVPAAVPMIAFLSGGLSPSDSDAYLNAMNQQNAPWLLSYSYGRALQQEALHVWAGKEGNWKAAQETLHHRARLTGLAQKGEYRADME